MRRSLPLLLAAGLVLGGAACGDDDEPAEATTTTTEAGDPADEATTTASEPDDDPTTTTTEADDPDDDPDEPDDGTVPIDPELQSRLPEVDGFQRELDDDESFDTETCDGNQLPATPVGQASATYESDVAEFDLGVVRFSSSSEASDFLEAFVAAAEDCAGPEAEVELSDLEDVGDEGFLLRLVDGDDRAWAYGAKDNDDVWLAFVELEEGEVEPGPEVLEALTAAVEG